MRVVRACRDAGLGSCGSLLEQTWTRWHVQLATELRLAGSRAESYLTSQDTGAAAARGATR